MPARTLLIASTILAASVSFAGCGKSTGKPTVEATQAAATSKSPHSHENWWCDEHGVPEAICAQCHPNVAAEFRAKGDWCKKHDCPDSQCFKCHPELEAKFAKEYVAKYGKQPPKPAAD